MHPSSPAVDGGTRRPGLWWLNPAVIVGLVVPGGLLLAAALDDSVYRLAWRTPKWLEWQTVLLLLGGVAVFMTASLLPLFGGARRTRRDWPTLTEPVLVRLRQSSQWLFGITVLGYVVLGLSGLRNGVRPQDIISAVLSQNTFDGELKAAFGTVPGVTTLTQVGIAYTIVAVLLLMHRRDRVIAIQLAVLVLLALARAYLFAERLAMLELALPVLALLAMAMRRRGTRVLRGLVRAGPFLLVPAVIIMFGLFEYSRSWTFWASRGGNFAEFVVQRFAGYYVTAYNNGQIALLFERVDGALPYRTLEAFWTVPGVEQFGLFDRLSGSVPHPSFDALLVTYGNPEFNSNCGLCDPFVDWGPMGGLIVLASLGLITGVAYRGFTDGRLGWVLIYPLFVTGLFEIPRYLYWTTGRSVPALLGLAAAGLWATRRRSPPARGITSIHPMPMERAAAVQPALQEPRHE